MQKNATTMQHPKLAYSIKELSRLMGICERKIHYEIEDGKLKKSQIGRRILILALEAERWLKEAEAV